MQHDSYNPPSIWKMVGVSVPLLLIVVFLMIAINTGDLFWFVSTFDEVPIVMTVHCYGQDVDVQPATSQFTKITALVREQLEGRKRWDSLSLSEETYQDYQTSPVMMVLELYYAGPVRVHSNVKFFSNVDTLVVPLDGRHAQTYPVFGRKFNRSAAGSLHVETTVPILDYIQSAGICQKP